MRGGLFTDNNRDLEGDPPMSMLVILLPAPLHAEHPIVGDKLHIRRGRLQRPDQQGRLAVHNHAMPAQDGERVVARPGDDRIDGLVVDRSHANSHVLMISF